MYFNTILVSHFPLISFFKGSMLSAVLLVLGCLLQRKVVTTEGHHGTNRHVFYAVRIDGGIRAARALAVQHGLEFIRRVSGSLKPLLLPPPMGLQFAFSKSGYWVFFSFCWAAKVLTSIFHLRNIWLSLNYSSISQSSISDQRHVG